MLSSYVHRISPLSCMPRSVGASSGEDEAPARGRRGAAGRGNAALALARRPEPGRAACARRAEAGAAAAAGVMVPVGDGAWTAPSGHRSQPGSRGSGPRHVRGTLRADDTKLPSCGKSVPVGCRRSAHSHAAARGAVRASSSSQQPSAPAAACWIGPDGRHPHDFPCRPQGGRVSSCADGVDGKELGDARATRDGESASVSWP